MLVKQANLERARLNKSVKKEEEKKKTETIFLEKEKMANIKKK